MLVYGDSRRIEDPRAKAVALCQGLERRRAAVLPIERHALLAELLVEAGELEQGLFDARPAPLGEECPGSLEAAASRLTRTIAGLLLASFRTLRVVSEGVPREVGLGSEGRDRSGDAPRGVSGAAASFRFHGDDTSAIESALDDLDALLARGHPATIEVSTPEGYAFYGLYPECYLAAAESALRSSDPLRVIGIRSIGTGLAALVAAAAGERAAVFSVRPQGHPFDRRLAVSAPLATAILDGTPQVAIVDEGPGLSGSSLGCVADWLEDRGVEPDAIAFFPSHRGDPGPYASARHQERWRRAHRHVATFEELFLSSAARWPLASWTADLTGEAEAPLEDLSAGRWREKLVPHLALWPAADVQGERRKFLLTTSKGRWLLKFAGLGRYGREKLKLARELDGLIPPLAGLRHGFLVGPWLEAAVPLPLVPDVDRRGLLEAVASYLARRVARLPADPRERGATPERLFEMTVHNTSKVLGAEASERLDPWRSRLPEIAHRERPVLTDNKPHAWEWLVMPDGRILKADALDHTRGNDLVGPQDVAWDLAGAAVELDLDESKLDFLASAVARESGTPRVNGLQLGFYTLAYLAFQIGRHTLCAEALQAIAPSEAVRMRTAVNLYGERLRQTVED